MSLGVFNIFWSKIVECFQHLELKFGKCNESLAYLESFKGYRVITSVLSNKLEILNGRFDLQSMTARGTVDVGQNQRGGESLASRQISTRVVNSRQLSSVVVDSRNSRYLLSAPNYIGYKRIPST